MESFKSLFFKFLKFGIVGVSGMVVHGGVLYLFKELVGLPPLLANTIGFVVAASWNYLFNRIWTFASKEKQVGVEYLKFFLVSLVGLAINNGSLWLFSFLLPLWKADARFYLLWLAAVAVTTVWNFFGNLLFTFKAKK